MEEKLHNQKWCCAFCKSTLGCVEDGECLRIKYKDFYVYIKGGNVEVVCRHCGKRNFLNYDNTKDIVPLKEQNT